MKNLFKKGAVATAVAGSLMISGVASADSVLAPLVIGVSGGAQTYFSIKARGNGTANLGGTSGYSANSNLHYVWFQKGKSVDDLYNLATPCTVSNNNGKVSPWDMVFQRAVGSAPSNFNLAAGSDRSQPNGYSAGDFVGFVVITDVANKNANPAVKDLANEGELSGFGYVVDAGNSFVLDYKLLNNHRSKIEGDFSAGFISKKSIDYSWMPTSLATTEWLTVVTGDDMLKAETGAGKYDATVTISQDTLAGSVSPRLPMGGSGIYDNDETVISGSTPLKVTCMGAYNRAAFSNDLQLSGTHNGGWTRMSVAASSGSTQVASGAITYKAELLNFANAAPEALFGVTSFASGVFGTATPTKTDGAIELSTSDATPYDISPPFTSKQAGVISFQPETSGHLSTTPEPHPNRPY
ncbi:MAG: hypothetical protein E6Q83_19325 [Thiothrix sp.]|nr:MAG: hypothetical protein E6Q83_19325 [Thiothrix sp.]